MPGSTPHFLLLLLLDSLVMLGCQPTVQPLPTRAPLVPTVAVAVADPPQGTVPPTWTPALTAAVHWPTPDSLPSATPLPTGLPLPMRTATSTPTGTATETPTETLPAPTPSAPVSTGGPNLLPNPSFEGGWYHVNGLPELQVPNLWTLAWDEGFNPLDPDPWNRFVRPESRVLSGDFLPPHEHSLFIWDGDHTVKIFKGEGALSFRLTTNVYLQPGTYVLEINVFPDLITGYASDGSKIWAPDPLSGELRFHVDQSAGNWILPRFGQRNTFSHAFDVTTAHLTQLTVSFRGRWAILNNGWFMDDWSLRRSS